jgi:flagellar biosynthetic protein FliQ
VTPERVLVIGHDALLTMLLLASPLLIVALVVGLAIGIVQAATQINEMTLAFIPKLLAMSLTMVIAGPWMLKVIVAYTREMIIAIPGMLR